MVASSKRPQTCHFHEAGRAGTLSCMMRFAEEGKSYRTAVAASFQLAEPSRHPAVRAHRRAARRLRRGPFCDILASALVKVFRGAAPNNAVATAPRATLTQSAAPALDLPLFSESRKDCALSKRA